MQKQGAATELQVDANCAVREQMHVLLHGQKHVSKLGDKLFPYKETEHCWQVSSDSKNVESI